MPHVGRTTRVLLDRGCGPGYIAFAMAGRVEHVDAVDISRGVLAYARALLNGRPNIAHQTPDELERYRRMADLAYSFAVVQRLTREALVDVLSLLVSKISQAGLLLLHFAVPGEGGWRTEAEWPADRSLAGDVKLRFAPTVSGGRFGEMEALISNSGFSDVAVRPLNRSIAVPCDDDLTKQYWLTAPLR